MPWTKCAGINVRRALLTMFIFSGTVIASIFIMFWIVEVYSLHPGLAIVGSGICLLSETTVMRFVWDSYGNHLYGFRDEAEFKKHLIKRIKNKK